MRFSIWRISVTVLIVHILELPATGVILMRWRTIILGLREARLCHHPLGLNPLFMLYAGELHYH